MSICVGHSKTLGIRGVLATEDINAGDVVEIASIIKIPQGDIEKIKETVLKKYIFDWEEGAVVCLGFGSLYNHSMDNNLETIRTGSKIIFKAKRDIEAGEELFIRYGDDEKEVWDFYEFENKM